MPCNIQARLRLSPSMWASFGSFRSVTIPGSSQSAEPLTGMRGQESRKPGREFRRRQDATHQVAFRKTRRKKVLARRFVGLGAGGIGQVVTAAALIDQRPHRVVAGHD